MIERSIEFSTKRSDYFYELPEELIAQDPLTDRSSSRLLVLHRDTGVIEHRTFRDVIEYLEPGDCLVINDTKVIPARLIGELVVDNEHLLPGHSPQKEGRPVEILLLKRLSDTDWECIVRPGKKIRKGSGVSFGGGKLTGEITEVKDDGNRVIRFSYKGIFEELLDELGTMPLPPYITHKLEDQSRYQTVYARNSGSAAAPTAGLHFTEDLLLKIEEKGVRIARVTLHVGLGTFRPVKEDDILEHKMHSEFYRVSEEAANLINETHKAGKRVICVGTTSCRTIESAASDDGIVRAGEDDTEIFIYPGYRFKALDCLITNFHLPESTLIMLVSALAGRSTILDAYREAVEKRYRFFSFGDAMLIL